MKPRYPPIAERAGYRCEYCRAPEVVFNFPLEVEYVVPQAKGGTGELNNLALASRACNAFKLDSLAGIDSETSQDAALFNPRLDERDVHFAFDPETAHLGGVTLVRRGTVARLRMNRPSQVRARRVWIEMGLFP